jgi:hypothetical protein
MLTIIVCGVSFGLFLLWDNYVYKYYEKYQKWDPLKERLSLTSFDDY